MVHTEGWGNVEGWGTGRVMQECVAAGTDPVQAL